MTATAMHDAFLAAVAARPDDDLPRLVYADFLDDHGQPARAEFIRSQIELANLPADDPRREELADRGRELLARHKGEWRLPEFRRQSQVFRRGFVEEVNVAAEWLIAHPDALTVPGPLRHLRAFNAREWLYQLASVPGLARLETLDLSNTTFGLPRDVQQFFTHARLDNLRRLVLRNCNFWEDEEVAALARCPVAARLKELDLSGNRLATPGLRAVARLPAFAGLEGLVFRADELESYSCADEEGAAAVAESKTLTGLKSVDLSDHYLGDGGFTRLVISPNAASLERLAVEYNEIGEGSDDGILAAVESPHLTNLRELSFGGNRLGPEGAEALAAWPHLERMRCVSLKECPLSDDVRAILRRSAWADKFVL